MMKIMVAIICCTVIIECSDYTLVERDGPDGPMIWRVPSKSSLDADDEKGDTANYQNNQTNETIKNRLQTKQDIIKIYQIDFWNNKPLLEEFEKQELIYLTLPDIVIKQELTPIEALFDCIISWLSFIIDDEITEEISSKIVQNTVSIFNRHESTLQMVHKEAMLIINRHYNGDYTNLCKLNIPKLMPSAKFIQSVFNLTTKQCQVQLDLINIMMQNLNRKMLDEFTQLLEQSLFVKSNKFPLELFKNEINSTLEKSQKFVLNFPKIIKKIFETDIVASEPASQDEIDWIIGGCMYWMQWVKKYVAMKSSMSVADKIYSWRYVEPENHGTIAIMTYDDISHILKMLNRMGYKYNSTLEIYKVRAIIKRHRGRSHWTNRARAMTKRQRERLPWGKWISPFNITKLY